MPNSNSETAHDNSDLEPFGPALPPQYKLKQTHAECSGTFADDGDISKGRASISSRDLISEESESSDNDDSYGPSLSLMANEKSEPSCRAPDFTKTHKHVLPESSVVKRESWMLELPPERAVNFGMGPRQFRKRPYNDEDSDRSGWTETPELKGKLKQTDSKNNDLEITKMREIEGRNKEMERIVKKISKKKKRDKSLLEIHRKHMKKKEKKEAKKRKKEGRATVERRPFDRNIDLQVHRFDESQKRAILQKAQLLNDRFAQGKSKFL